MMNDTTPSPNSIAGCPSTLWEIMGTAPVPPDGRAPTAVSMRPANSRPSAAVNFPSPTVAAIDPWGSSLVFLSGHSVPA